MLIHRHTHTPNNVRQWLLSAKRRNKQDKPWLYKAGEITCNYDDQKWFHGKAETQIGLWRVVEVKWEENNKEDISDNGKNVSTTLSQQSQCLREERVSGINWIGDSKRIEGVKVGRVGWNHIVGSLLISGKGFEISRWYMDLFKLLEKRSVKKICKEY